MAKGKSGKSGAHEHEWVKIVYGLPTNAALEAAKAGRLILAGRDRHDNEPKFECVVCGVKS